MSVTSWLRNRKTPSIRRPAFRPRLQSLEDRCVPSFGWAAATGAGSAVATDSAGNAYVTGGNSVAKYSQGGAVLWTVSIGSSATNNQGIAVDGIGNVFVGGSYSGTANFGSTILTSPGGTDVFVGKLDGATGSVVWARNGLTVAGKTLVNNGVSVAADAAGSVYVADVLKVASGFPWNVAIFKLDGGTGTTQWTDQLLGVSSGNGNNANSGYSEGPRLTVAGGSVYVTGFFALTVDFDPGPGTYTLTSNGIDNGFVVKLTSGGALVWADAFRGGGRAADHCYPRGIAVDTSGNVYSTGTISGSVDFDPAPDGKRGAGQLVLSSENGASYISKLNAAGNLVWAKQFNSSANTNGASAASLAVDGVGAVYLTGSFSGTTSFNPAGGGIMTSAGGSDIFVSKLNTNGVFQWAVRAGGTGNDSGNGIAIDPFGVIYVAGTIGAGTVDFDLTQSYFDNRDLLTGPGGFLWQIMQP